MMSKLPYCEDVNYWKTGVSSPDTWMEKTKRCIKGINGRILSEAFGNDGTQSAFLLQFQIGNDTFKLIWPVLSSRVGNEKAARIQAATFIYHDVKAKCDTVRILGARTAFFNYLMLPDGRTAAHASVPELMIGIPNLFLPQTPTLSSGEVIEGEIVG